MDKTICFIVQYECNFNITIVHTQLDTIFWRVRYISAVPILPIGGTLRWLSDLFRIFRFTAVQKDKTNIQHVHWENLIDLVLTQKYNAYINIIT